MTEIETIAFSYGLALVAIIFIFFADNEDDDDEGGGMMQPVYLGVEN
ncbi:MULTISPECIES: hypothetical protein [Prochlorococcus]|nr:MULTISPECIES: hypothetical protein [Prochlorococcus]KGG12179.1 hypothetical protein EV05_1384 [Prochlorococcus sp. MIT 0601]